MIAASSQHTARRIVGTALQQIALAAVVSLLLAGWLHIPDANAFEVFGSVVIGLLIFGIAGAGEAAIALRLTQRPATVRRLLLGTGVLLVAVLAWLAVSFLIDHLSANDALRAGYLNSRFPARLRNAFSYEHLVQWFAWLWIGLRWVVGGLLGAAVFACITCDKPLRGLAMILRSSRYWLALVLLTLVGAIVTGALLNWTPGHGLRAESLSLLFRLLVVVVLDAAVIANLFHAMARRVQDAGTTAPDVSHPRTAGMP